MNFYAADYCDFERIFLRHSDFEVRTKKSIWGDTIRKGVFKATLTKHGISQIEIAKAVREKIIGEEKISPNGSTHRIAYVWLGHELKQVTRFKKIMAWVKTKLLWSAKKIY
jgi:hypothetical protein